MEMKRAKYRHNKVAKTLGLLGHLLLTRQILMIINILKKMFNLPSLEISDGQLAPTQATQNHKESQKKVTTLLIHFSSGKTHLIYIPSFHKGFMPGYIGNPIMIIFVFIAIHADPSLFQRNRWRTIRTQWDTSID